MSTVQRYRARRDKFIVAVQIDLDTDGIRYQKWGHAQHGKAGDWLAKNGNDVYTIDKDSFAKTYAPGATPGTYVKTAKVFAVQAKEDGSVPTKEGVTNYVAGDYVVSNNEDGSDAYAIKEAKFNDLYELDA